MRAICASWPLAASSGCRCCPTFQPCRRREWLGSKSITWFAVMAPPGTHAKLTGDINKAIAEVLCLPDVKEQFSKMGIQPVGGSVVETEKFIAEERLLWGDVIRTTGVKIE